MPVSQLTMFDDAYETTNPVDKMTEQILLQGSGFANGKHRIYEFTLTKPTIQCFAEFLKNEYGVGGSSRPITDSYEIFNECHDGKGIRYKWFDHDGKEVLKVITWNEAARFIFEMVEKGIYPSSTKVVG